MAHDPLDFYRTASRRGDHTAPWYVSSRLAALFGGVRIEGRVLDVGAGVGGNQGALAELGLASVATDVSETALKELRAGHESTPAVVGDGGRLPFADASFGAVVITEVLEHVADPERVVGEAARVVVPNGYLYVTSPNYANAAGVRKWWRDRRTGRHDWNPWGAHQGGYEAFMTRYKLRRMVEHWFDVVAEEGLDPGLGLTAGLPSVVRAVQTPRGIRAMYALDRKGWVKPDRRVSRLFGMNTALLAQRRGP